MTKDGQPEPLFDYPGDGSDSVMPDRDAYANVSDEQRELSLKKIREIRHQRAQDANSSNVIITGADVLDPDLPPAPVEPPVPPLPPSPTDQPPA